MSETITTTHPQLATTLAKIDTLAAALTANDPNFATHLKAIHRTLIQYEELSHLLTEEQIAVIVAGGSKKLGISLAAETTATKGSKGKSLKNVSAEDL